MDLKLPPLGEGADSGTVVTLFVKEGDQIAKDQPLLELENEKAVATIPSTGSGMVTKVFVKAGDKLSVGQRILSFEEAGGAMQSEKSGTAPTPKAQPGERAKPAAPTADVKKEAEADQDSEQQPK